MDGSTPVKSISVPSGQLRSLVERIERLEEDKKGISEDIKEIYASAKALGYDTKVMRKLIVLRKMDQADRQEMEALLDVYENAMQMALPLE